MDLANKLKLADYFSLRGHSGHIFFAHGTYNTYGHKQFKKN